MMGRELKPHGTEAAARRHQRAGEPLCPECRRAWSGRRVRQQSRAEDRAREAAPEPGGQGAGRLSEVDEVRANLGLVVRAMEAAPASAVAALSRRREELDNRLRKLEDEEARASLAVSGDGTGRSFEQMMRDAGIDS